MKELETLKLKVRKIYKCTPMNGPDLYDICFSLLSFHPKKSEIKEHPVNTPNVTVTANHLLPSDTGFIMAEKLQIGDIIHAELPLVTK